MVLMKYNAHIILSVEDPDHLSKLGMGSERGGVVGYNIRS